MINRKKWINDLKHNDTYQTNKDKFVIDLATQNTPLELAEWIYDLLLTNRFQVDEDTKITITQSDYKKLLSIFKIKGIRGFNDDGSFILETRGLKMNRPNNLFDEETTDEE